MATSAEQTFIMAVAVAEAARQVSKAAALVTYNSQSFGGATGALTSYVTAIKTADNTYYNAVQTASNAAGGIGLSLGNQGSSSQVGLVNLGQVGQGGVIPSLTATFGGVA